MVTEQEMRDFFQRMIDQFATLSTQASRVEGLEQRVQELADRLRSLEDENRNLHQQVQGYISKVSEMENEANGLRRDFDNERAVTNNLREVLISRDSKVTDLETHLADEKNSHRITTSERDDARQRNTELEGQLSSFRETVDRLERESNDWMRMAQDYEKQVNDLKSRLDRVQSIIQPLHAVPSADVA